MPAPRNLIEMLRVPWMRIVFEATAVVAAVWLLHLLSGVLTPVLIGLAVAYMLDPLVGWLARHGMRRQWAVGLIFGGTALTAVAVTAVGVPLAWHEGVYLYRVAFVGDDFLDQPGPNGQPPDGVWQPGEPLTRDINHNGRYDPSYWKVVNRFLVAKGLLQPSEAADDATAGDPDRWWRTGVDRFFTTLQDSNATFFTRVGAVFGAFGGWLMAILLIPIYGYFFSLNLPRVTTVIQDHIPIEHRSRALRILHEINVAVGAFFRGRVTICALLAGVAIIGLGIARVPSFLVLGIIIGISTAIPLAVGLTMIPVAMLLYLGDADRWQYITAGSTFAAIMGLEAVLVAAIMGKGVEMHPVVVLVAILAFGTLLGGVGVLLAVPLAATARILLRELLYPHLRRMAGLDAAAPAGSSQG